MMATFKSSETELKDIALSEDLNVAIMTAPLQSAVAEKAADGNCYFAVDALLEPPAATAKEAPSIVLWDASASRDKTDHDAELAFLEKILPQNQQLTLIAFRDKPLQSATFNSPKALVDAIRQIPFDGASNIAAAIAAVVAGLTVGLHGVGVGPGLVCGAVAAAAAGGHADHHQSRHGKNGPFLSHNCFPPTWCNKKAACGA